MTNWANSVRSGDPDNIEGRAAAYYWKNLFPELPWLTRGQDGPSPNALLNYGYAIVRAVIARALVSSGMLPTLGIHHHNRYNAYCLADDIMEPFRPVVDRIVYNVNPKNDSMPLDKETRKRLLGIPLEKIATKDGNFALNDQLNIVASRLVKSIMSGENCLSFD